MLFYKYYNRGFKAINHLGGVAAIALLVHNPLAAAPVGETVRGGQFEFTRSEDGLTTTVAQSSHKGVIEWAGFDLAENETVKFTVPAVNSATLNIISSGAVSTISGTVNSNGILYFVNPNGLVFDSTSRVTANGFTAFTGSIIVAEFMDSDHSLLNLSERGEGAISLNGRITAPVLQGNPSPSMIVAAGGTVTVMGNLTATKGSVSLSSTHLTEIGNSAVISVGLSDYDEGGRIDLTSVEAVIIADRLDDKTARLTTNRGTISLSGASVTVGGELTATKGNLTFNSTTETNLTHTVLLEASMDEFAQMGNITLNSDGRLGISGETTVKAGQITAKGTIVTVSGGLNAINGSITLTSVSSTVIGPGGSVSTSISSDKGLNRGNNENRIVIASGGSVVIIGNVTAVDTSLNAQGGQIKLSAVSALTVLGTVNTSATSGTIGQLTLSAPVIEIGTGETDGITYVSAEKLASLSQFNDLILDTTGVNSSDGQIGTITVTEATSVSSNLTLKSNAITVRKSLSAARNLSLIQVGIPSTDGISIFDSALSAGRNLSLLQTGTIASDRAGILLSGSGISFTVGSSDRTIRIKTRSEIALFIDNGEHFNFTVGRVRLDLGSGRIISGGDSVKSLNANGLEVIYNGALSGNLANLAIGSGSLTVMVDQHDQTGALTLGDPFSSQNMLIIPGFDFTPAANSEPGLKLYERGGLTVTSRGGLSSVNRLGLIYGGTVELNGVINGVANRLFVIEAEGISVTAASEFRHSLTLISVGAGIANNNTNVGILIKANLAIGSKDNPPSNLSLRQSGEVTGDGIVIQSSIVSTTGSLLIEQTQSLLGSGLLIQDSTLTLGKDFILDQKTSYGTDGVSIQNLSLTTGGALRFNLQFDQGSQFSVGGNGIEINNSNFTIGKQMEIIHRGAVGRNGINLIDSKFKTGDSVILSHAGFSAGDGLFLREIDIHSGADLSLLQNGIVADGFSGIRFEAIDFKERKNAHGVTLHGGSSDANWITLYSRARVGLTLARFDNFDLNTAKIRIDLGTGTMRTDRSAPRLPFAPPPPPPPSTPPPSSGAPSQEANAEAPVQPDVFYDLYAVDLDVYYSGANKNNLARLRISYGSFTYVTDRRARVETTILNNEVGSANSAIGWTEGQDFINSTQDDRDSYSYNNSTGLRIRTYGGLDSITGNGIVYGGIVEINGLTSTSSAGALTYIEGAAIRVTGNSASNFKSSVTIISNGSWAGTPEANTGIEVTAGISAGPETKNTSTLSLIQRGDFSGDGIRISGATLNRTNSIYLFQHGTVAGRALAITDNSTVTIDNSCGLNNMARLR